MYLPEEFFGKNDDGSLIVAGYGTVIDPLIVIAESLATIDNHLFHLRPDIQYENNEQFLMKIRIFTAYLVAMLQVLLLRAFSILFKIVQIHLQSFHYVYQSILTE